MHFILIFMSLVCLQARADMPGKKSMAESKVTFQDLNKFKDWEFHWEAEYGGGKGIMSGDTSVAIPGSGGAPADAYFWAINKSTGKSTDSIHFSNYYDPDYIVILKSIAADTLAYKMVSLTNANAEGDEDKGGLQDVKNKKLIEDARDIAYSKNTKYFIYIGLPLLALIILIVYFIKRKKRTSEG